MSKTWLSALTALVLVAASSGIFLARRAALGMEADGPRGASSWRITLVATGELAADETSLSTPRPPDFRRQHIFDERLESQELLPPGGKRNSRRRDIVWRRSGIGRPQPFRVSYSFQCLLGTRRPTPGMVRLTQELDAAPADGGSVRPGPGIESTRKDLADKASELTVPGAPPEEQVRGLFNFVDGLEDDPASAARTAAECLREGRGDALARSRLLVAMCRSRDLPARMLAGLVLADHPDQALHFWAEAWVGGHWLPMCPTYHHFGPRHFPPNYLVLHVGEEDLFHGRAARLRHGFRSRELSGPSHPADDQPVPRARLLWQKASLYTLGPGERHVVKFLLLLPLAALIVSVFRTIIGVPTFGTFSPALVGLAFLDLKALPWGLGIFVTTVMVGWLLRRLIDRYHLLLVPRTSVLLTLIVIFLITVVMIASHQGVATTQYIALFPLVILTHLVERFWTVETEDGTAASFRTLAGTMAVAVTISFALSPQGLATWMFRYPETLGVVLAAQFLIGRYTGYRVSELFRFRDLADAAGPGPGDGA